MESHRSLQRVYKIAVCFRLLATTWCIAVSGGGLIHLVYNALQDLPVCIQFMYTAYICCTAYEFREPHRSLQRLYEIAGRFILPAMTWCSAESVCTLVHILYNVLRDLKICVQLSAQPTVAAWSLNLVNCTDP